MDTERQSFWAHETAYVDDPGSIGEGTIIWHFSHVMKGAVVGRQCRLGQNVFIGDGAVVGNQVKIQNSVSVYEGVVLEDGVFCGPSVAFTNVINPRSRISRRHEFQPTLVKEGATIGANATVLCGLTIGRFSFVGAGSVVTKSVPDFALVYGNPARRTGWMCVCGIRLQVPQDGRERRLNCTSCQRTYCRLLRGRTEELQLLDGDIR